MTDDELEAMRVRARRAANHTATSAPIGRPGRRRRRHRRGVRILFAIAIAAALWVLVLHLVAP